MIVRVVNRNDVVVNAFKSNGRVKLKNQHVVTRRLSGGRIAIGTLKRS